MHAGNHDQWQTLHTSGDWAIQQIVVSEEGARLNRMYAVPGEPAAPTGTYYALVHNGVLVDSSMPAACADLVALDHTKGRVLITGLGLGMAAIRALDNIHVRSVLAIEPSPDVIHLAEQWLFPQLSEYDALFAFRVRQADPWQWEPEQRFDWAWHDLWPDASNDSIAESVELMRRYKPHCRAQMARPHVAQGMSRREATAQFG